MSIPHEVKIGILGAGGKMGMRISANLRKLPNEILKIRILRPDFDPRRTGEAEPLCSGFQNPWN